MRKIFPIVNQLRAVLRPAVVLLPCPALFANAGPEALAVGKLAEIAAIGAINLIATERTHRSAQRVADGIFPVVADKDDVEVKKSERSVIKIMDAAIQAAKEAGLPAVTSVLESRRRVAEQRITTLDAKAPG